MNALDYEWRLREVMATRGLFSTTKLIPLLNDRGIHLSASQIYRLAAEKPERLTSRSSWPSWTPWTAAPMTSSARSRYLPAVGRPAPTTRRRGSPD